MTKSTPPQLILTISSTALFDLSESHQIYQEQGIDAYCGYQIEHENDILTKGEAFSLVEKLLAINKRLGERRVEVILVSRNSADTGLRAFNSIKHYQLDIERAAFVGGQSPNPYLKAFNSHLFLSTNANDVRNALSAGFAAATILPGGAERKGTGQLRIAFDGDAVLFSDEAERIYKESGLEAFQKNEVDKAHTSLADGPFRGFLAALNQLQSDFLEDCPIRTALVTARSAPSHERVIRTLRDWGIRLDESLFLGGLDKSPFLEAFGADIFFDDQTLHCEKSRQVVPTGHVPHGVRNS